MPERRISAVGFGNKVLTKEEETWREEGGCSREKKWKRWFNFHCDTEIFKALAGENHKPLQQKKKEWRKHACSIFTTNFIRAQRDKGGRKDGGAELPFFSLSPWFNFAPISCRVGLKLPLSCFPVTCLTAGALRDRALIWGQLPHCFHSSSTQISAPLLSVSVFPFLPSCPFSCLHVSLSLHVSLLSLLNSVSGIAKLPEIQLEVH